MSSSPPVAPARPDEGARDPYAWMRDAGDPALLAYLAAERAYYDQRTAPTAAVRKELTGEMSARVAPAAESVSWRRGNFEYFTRTVAGLEYEQFCRRPVPGPPTGERDPAAGEPGSIATEQGTAAEVLLDQNLLLQDPECGGGYVALGVRQVSPDGALLAYSVDFDGDEVYQLRIRDLASGTDTTTAAGQPERIGRTYYGLAWSADSRSVFYVVTNAAYRAHEIWRHDIGTDPAQDVLVFNERDERFDVIVRAARSGAYILLETESRDTTETLVIPATDPGAAPGPGRTCWSPGACTTPGYWCTSPPSGWPGCGPPARPARPDRPATAGCCSGPSWGRGRTWARPAATTSSRTRPRSSPSSWARSTGTPAWTP